MSYTCDLCGKGVMHGKNVSHSHRKTRATFMPNLQNVTVMLKDKKQKMRICTRCLRSLYKEPKR